MNDATFYLYNNGFYDADTDGGGSPEVSDFSGSDDGGGGSDSPAVLPDGVDASSGSDTGDAPDAGTGAGDSLGDAGGSSGEEDGETEEGSSSGTDGEADGAEEGTEGIGGVEGTEGIEGIEGTGSGEIPLEITEALLSHSEMLAEIRDIFAGHAGAVDSFMSGLTVSGNVLTVTPDDGTSALIMQSVDQQVQIMDRLDGMSGTLFLVFFVLVFDFLHRSAKRIVKNLTGGDRNGTNS